LPAASPLSTVPTGVRVIVVADADAVPLVGETVSHTGTVAGSTAKDTELLAVMAAVGAVGKVPPVT